MHTITLPPTSPVMVLSHALLLPGALLPLYIFEPRYRDMLKFSLAHDRMFAVAMIRQGRDKAVSPSDFHSVAGLGLIRASVTQRDGSSHLILQGVRRVKLEEFVPGTPFWQARLTAVKESVANREESEQLAAQLRSICQNTSSIRKASPFMEIMLGVDGQGGALADLVAATCIPDCHRQQQILECSDINQRLRMVLDYMENQRRN